ncbi:DUF2948 family protein [Micromonospora sp. STR1s_5]|nr:DUF2948 family protein [Micromonospora sp. STR1s_5]
MRRRECEPTPSRRSAVIGSTAYTAKSAIPASGHARVLRHRGLGKGQAGKESRETETLHGRSPRGRCARPRRLYPSDRGRNRTLPVAGREGRRYLAINLPTDGRPMEPLKLAAFDADDLAIVSAHLQDAVIRVGDVTYLPEQRRFALVGRRFDWEARDGEPRRRLTGCHFERVAVGKDARDRPRPPGRGAEPSCHHVRGRRATLRGCDPPLRRRRLHPARGGMHRGADEGSGADLGCREASRPRRGGAPDGAAARRRPVGFRGQLRGSPRGEARGLRGR